MDDPCGVKIEIKQFLQIIRNPIVYDKYRIMKRQIGDIHTFCINHKLIYK